ncbi:MAG: hypothetical protein PF588_05570 [Candidatus Kapabacteria bacterium]|nr:hypothetical protein [Candidatus Kapabacteria bacterium]
MPETIELKIEDIKERLNRFGGPINCEFSVNDQNDLSCGAEWNIPVDLNVIDSSHYKYSLILFDFSSFDLQAKNRKIIDLMSESVRTDADVSISGFADLVGDSLFNLNFSKRRAMATAKELFGRKFKSVNDNTFEDSSSEVLLSDFKFQFVDGQKTKKINLTISGKGETMPMLHDNRFPEGRFYCRTVTVDIVNKAE